jgi:hypothetical protein
VQRLVGQTDGEGAQEVSESSRKKAKTRPISSGGGGGGGRRGDGDDDGDDDEQVSAGNLDLNATPLGFDLNAPVVEEEEEEELLSQGGSVSPSPLEAEVQSKLDDHDVSETTETKQPTAAPSVAAKSEEASPPASPLSLPPPIVPKIEAVVDSSAQFGPAVKFEDDEESHQYSHSIGGGGDVVAAGTTPELSGIKEEEEEEEGSNQADTLSVVKGEHLEEEVEEEKPPVAIPAVFRQRYDPVSSFNCFVITCTYLFSKAYAAVECQNWAALPVIDGDQLRIFWVKTASRMSGSFLQMFACSTSPLDFKELEWVLID